jgi:hypothetical protein
MVYHGFRRLHKFVFQTFLNLIRYKQLRIDLSSNGSNSLFFYYEVCVFAYKLADRVIVFTYFQLQFYIKILDCKR